MTTSRLSYASSPESDLELSPGPSASLSLGNLPQLVKSSSDPSIATNQDNLDRDREEMVEGMPPPYTVRSNNINQRIHISSISFTPLINYSSCHKTAFGLLVKFSIRLMVEIWINIIVRKYFESYHEIFIKSHRILTTIQRLTQED